VRDWPLLAPVVVSITTGIPDTTLAKVYRPRVRRWTGRSMRCIIRANSHDPGPLLAKRRRTFWKLFAWSKAMGSLMGRQRDEPRV
jgi:hypothetical protein